MDDRVDNQRGHLRTELTTSPERALYLSRAKPNLCYFGRTTYAWS